MSKFLTTLFVFYIGATLIGSVFDGVIENFTGIGEQSIYMKRCNVFDSLKECESGKGVSHISKIRIKTDFNNQRVIIMDGSVIKTHQCRVLDSQNWDCMEGERHIFMRDGNFNDSISGEFKSDGVILYQLNVGWPAYYLHRLRYFFSSDIDYNNPLLQQPTRHELG